MFLHRRWISLCCLLTITSFAAEWPPKTWTQACQPFRITDSVYYVGGRELTAYLIVDDAGMILINVGMAENAGMVLASIHKLGFDPKNIKYLLITQAHMDHAGGAAILHKETGAQVMVGEADVILMKQGGLGDYVFGDDLAFEAVPSTKGLRHGAVLKLGALKLQTIATPGHTPGSSSWLMTDNGQKILFQGSVSLLEDAKLEGNTIYPHAIRDFGATIARLKQIEANIILPDHMVFVHPKGVTHEALIDPQWFKQEDILDKQIERTQKALAKRQ